MEAATRAKRNPIGIDKLVALLLCAIALAVQWFTILERTSAAIWNWYKFWGYGSEPLDLGRQAQLMFYLLSAVFAAISLLIWRTSKNSWYATVARCQLRAFIAALFIWTVVLASPLVAPFSRWR